MPLPSMKKLAARDYEDLLQVGNPFFNKINSSCFMPVLNPGLRGFVAQERGQDNWQASGDLA
jgi:hypothetical protein